MCPFCNCNAIEFLYCECCWDMAEFFDLNFRFPTEVEVVLWQEEKEDLKQLFTCNGEYMPEMGMLVTEPSNKECYGSFEIRPNVPTIS